MKKYLLLLIILIPVITFCQEKKETISKEFPVSSGQSAVLWIDNINGSVLSKVMLLIKQAWAPDNNKKENAEVGELDYLNMARAMQPVGGAPANLPTAPGTPPSSPTNTPNIKAYSSGNDPYREPAE